jgi:hypothetical protein
MDKKPLWKHIRSADAAWNLGAWLALAVVLLLAAHQLRSQGRLWWCACGQAFLWSGDVSSRHNSQHLFDPYSLTHVVHGILFYGPLAWACPRLRMDWRLCLSVLIEVVWEVVENTNFVIQRYRTATAALGYEGDTIANSLGDTLAVVVGFALARRVGWRGSVALVAVIELILLVWIRDNLLLNIVMLVYPIDAIKTWQLGHGL